MNSIPAPRFNRWLLTTCRDRLAHLRESLPAALEWLPLWTPVVVCCDDPASTEYARGECAIHGRGLVLPLIQGQYFNKLEAERYGTGYLVATIATAEASPDDLVCFWDADIVATRMTSTVLDPIVPPQVAVCGWGAQPDDFGFLVCPLGLLWRAFGLVEANTFEGYGPEDMALRIAIWSLMRQPFLQVPAEWAHRQHSTRLRSRHYAQGVRGSSAANAAQMEALAARLIPTEDRARLDEDAMVSPKRLDARNAH